MTLLLDTHVVLWAVTNRLGKAARAAIQGAGAAYVSAVTIWELEIKRSTGRLRAPSDLMHTLDERGYERLGITFEHASEAGRLPPLHGDPFDRLLVAQARLEGLTLATADEEIKRYDVRLLDVQAA